jgi:thiamine kinase-like enzyme
MNVDFSDIIAIMPARTDVKDLQVKPFGGLTNTNYLVTVNAERFVMRIGCANSALLEINREYELEALSAASSAGIGPEVIRFTIPEGHLVTRLIEGRHWEVKEYRRPENLLRIVKVLKHLHALSSIRGTFSPFRRVESYTRKAGELDATFPEDFNCLAYALDTFAEMRRLIQL